MSNSLKSYKFIEVCAGAGGLSKGFTEKGFIPILLNDNNKHCCETLKLNNTHSNVEILCKSMDEIDYMKYSTMDIDVLMGGVPCQSFSHAGKREGLKDNRGKLMFQFIDMVHTIYPKIFVIENVKGLITLNKGKTLKLILNKINEYGKYKVQYKVLNSNDYNVPQKRERLFIVGVLNTIQKEFKFPKPYKYKPILKDVLQGCPSSKGIMYNKKKYDLMKLIPQDGCWVNLPIELQKEYLGKSYYSGGGKRGILKRLSMDKPCLTLLTTPSQKQTERCHPIETRPLQILEYARIQTFPDDYKFAGSVNQIYKQIGNAVPVNLSKAVAKEVLYVLD